MNNLRFIYFLTNIRNLGNIKIKNIASCFSNPEDFFRCSKSDLKKIDGIDSVISEEIYGCIKNKDKILREFDALLDSAFKKNIKITSVFEADYPENLKKIFDAPVMLYYKGNLSENDRYSISIVGTRSPTEYGKYNCEKFSEALSFLKIPLISGFARGIDTIVHNVALNSGNLTYAVFGCGADVIYPPENRKLYFELSEKGAVLTEFQIGAKPDKVNFPRRNRIISGISLGTLVIESGIKGGALLTAEIAVDQNKEVFALPGYINSRQSDGTNELIKRGQAKLVTNTDDIVVELQNRLKPFLKTNDSVANAAVSYKLNESEEMIYSLLEYEPVHIDEIKDRTLLPVSDCLVNLLGLEFKNLIKQLPGKYFIKI